MSRDWESVGADVMREPAVKAGWRLARERVAGLPISAAMWGRANCHLDLIDMLASAYLQGVYDASNIKWGEIDRKETTP